MLSLLRTTSDHTDFKKLTALFDEYLVDIDGDEKDFFAQYNQIHLDHVVICYDNGIAVGCGAFKVYEPQVIEVKRMFVHPEHRNKGVAAQVLSELESWAIVLNFTTSILETSIKLQNAIALYRKFGYYEIPNYGQYIGVESSVCMKKFLK
jgi:putative acetyltransferase